MQVAKLFIAIMNMCKKILPDGPVAEFIEQDLSTSISIDLVRGSKLVSIIVVQEVR